MDHGSTFRTLFRMLKSKLVGSLNLCVFFSLSFQISLSSDFVILSWKENLPISAKNNDKKHRDMKWIGVTLVRGLILGTSCLSNFLKFLN